MINLLSKFLLFAAFTSSTLLFAQASGAPEGSKLSAAEIAVLREALKEPPPLNGLKQKEKNLRIFIGKMDMVPFQ